MRWVLGLVIAVVCAGAPDAPAAEPLPIHWRIPGGMAAPATPIRFDPAEVVLGEQTVGEMSAIQKVTVRNSGTGRARLGAWSVVGDASIESTCGRELAPGAQCQLQLRFVPAAPGLRRATVMVLDESHGSLLSLGVLGKGVLPAQPALASGASVRRRPALPRARPGRDERPKRRAGGGQAR